MSRGPSFVAYAPVRKGGTWRWLMPSLVICTEVFAAPQQSCLGVSDPPRIQAASKRDRRSSCHQSAVSAAQGLLVADYELGASLAGVCQLGSGDERQARGNRSAVGADITYIRLELEYVYLAVVLDAYPRRVVGWAIEADAGS